MSVITIQCRLVAKEETLRHLWELMTQKNTPLINEFTGNSTGKKRKNG